MLLLLHLTNLRLGHHGGVTVTERREGQAEICFFVPLGREMICIKK